jgi:hypothetical protein
VGQRRRELELEEEREHEAAAQQWSERVGSARTFCFESEVAAMQVQPNAAADRPLSPPHADWHQARTNRCHRRRRSVMSYMASRTLAHHCGSGRGSRAAVACTTRLCSTKRARP